MEIGIKGSAELQITDHVSNEVITVKCDNLITNFGLKRLFAPKNLHERTATHFCFGYRTTDPTHEEEVVPDNYTVIPVYAETGNWLNDVSAYGRWSQASGALDSIPVGTTFNHMYLAYKDPDGILWPMTSLMFVNKLGELFEYVHSDTTSLYATYFINVNITSSVLPGEIKSVTFSTTQLPNDGVLYRDTKEDKVYYEDQPNKNYGTPAMIEGGDGVFLENGTFQQKYKITTKAYSYGRDFTFLIGFLHWKFTTTNYRATATYQLELNIKQLPEEYLEPRAATSIVVSPPAYINNDYDRRQVKVSAPPYQWIDIYYGNLFISTHYIGPLGYIFRNSWISTAYDPTGKEVTVERWAMSSGDPIRIVSRTLKGSTEVTLMSPDLESEDAVALWWIGPTTIRVVAHINDTVDIMWNKDIYEDGASRGGSTGNWVESGNRGKCTTVFNADEQTYYCDIELANYDPLLKPIIGYKVTDLAGNVFTGTYSYKAYYANNYMEGMSYEQAKDVGSSYGGQVEGNSNDKFSKELNNYHKTLRLLSAEIK